MPQLELFSSKNDNGVVEKLQPAPPFKKADVDLAEDTEGNREDISAVMLAEESLLHRHVATLPVQNDPPGKAEESDNDIVFANENISVRIKKKKAEDVVAVVEKKSTGKTIRLPQKRGRKSLKDIESEVDLIEVPDDEELFKKQYYAISEVAKWFRVNTSLIRFWENEFDILKPRKNRKGDRLFRPEDIKNIHLIYHLLRQRKYSIEGAKEFIKADKGQADIQLQLTKSLQKFKSFLLELKANLQS